MAQEAKQVTMQWVGRMAFEGGEPGGPRVATDASNREAASPVILLLVAVAGCTGADVVSILEKMRVSLQELRIDVAGARQEEHPRRFVALQLRYRLRGEGLDEAKARRAIDLSIEKYCSVVQTLAPDVRISYELELPAV
jgi:putative redox protein